MIRVVWFALNLGFRGAVTTSGTRCADDFYATVEHRALSGLRSSPSMFIEAFCDYRNDQAIRFWLNQEFTDIGPAFGNEELRRFLRLAELQPLTTATTD